MAKKEEQKSNGIGRVKFRYADSERFFDLDVNNIKNETGVVEGLKSIANALAGRNMPTPRALPAKPNGTVEVITTPEEDTVEIVDSEDEVTEAAESEPTTGNDVNGASRPKRRPAPRAPKFLSDLKLTDADIALADFVKEKAPDGDMDKYAVIAKWFKDHFSTEEVSIDHIFTAYKTLGWQSQLPSDPGQTFRNLKNNKNWFDSGKQRGFYRINWNGEDAVNKMGVTEQ